MVLVGLRFEVEVDVVIGGAVGRRVHFQSPESGHRRFSQWFEEVLLRYLGCLHRYRQKDRD